MATVGCDAAVVEMPEHGTVTGHAAWLTWIPRSAALRRRGKTTTIVAWGWNVITKKRGKRIMVTDEDLEGAAAED